MENKIYSINGPVVTISGNTGLSMMEMVYGGQGSRLVGEVIGINDRADHHPGLRGDHRPAQPASRSISTGGPLSATLGPGILDNIFDGIERPLKAIEETIGRFHRAAGVTRVFSG